MVDGYEWREECRLRWHLTCQVKYVSSIRFHRQNFSFNRFKSARPTVKWCAHRYVIQAKNDKRISHPHAICGHCLALSSIDAVRIAWFQMIELVPMNGYDLWFFIILLTVRHTELYSWVLLQHVATTEFLQLDGYCSRPSMFVFCGRLTLLDFSTSENRKVVSNKHFRFICDRIHSNTYPPAVSDKPPIVLDVIIQELDIGMRTSVLYLSITIESNRKKTAFNTLIHEFRFMEISNTVYSLQTPFNR